MFIQSYVDKLFLNNSCFYNNALIIRLIRVMKTRNNNNGPVLRFYGTNQQLINILLKMQNHSKTNACIILGYNKIM